MIQRDKVRTFFCFFNVRDTLFLDSIDSLCMLESKRIFIYEIVTLFHFTYFWTVFIIKYDWRKKYNYIM